MRKVRELVKSKVQGRKQPHKPLKEEPIRGARDIEILYDIGSLINQSLDLDTVLSTALEMASSVTGFEMGGIHLLNEEGNALELKSQIRQPPAVSEAGRVLKYGEGLSGRAVMSNQPVISSVDDYPSARVAPFLKEAGVQTLLAFPLRAKGKAVGAISLLSRSPRNLTPGVIDLLEGIGNQIGIAIENARLFSNVAEAKSEWETTFNAVTDLILIQDKDYRILRANQAVYKRLGLKPTEIIKKKCHELFYNREIPCEGCYLTEVLRAKKPTLGERESEYLRGIFRHYAFPILDEAGEVIAAVDLAREITEEKRLDMEKEVVNSVNSILTSSLDLRESIKAIRSELKRVFDFERMSIVLFDEGRKGFRFFALEKDYDAEEWVGNVVYPWKGTHFEIMAKTGSPLIIDNSEGDSWIGKKLLEEEEIRFSLLFPLEYEGKIIGTMNFGSKKTSPFSEDQFSLLQQIAPGLAIFIQNTLFFEEIKRSEEKYRAVVEGALDGICIVGEDYRINYVNERLIEIHGYRKEESIGRDFRDFLDDESKRLLADREDQEKKGMKLSPYFELTIRSKDEGNRRVEISARKIKDLKGKVNIIGILKDITERKQAEEALRQSEETARRLSRENAIMAEIGRIVSSTLNIDDVYERFAEKVRELIPFDRITLNIFNPKDNTVRTAYVAGLDVPDRLKGSVINAAGSISGEVIHTRTNMLVRTEDLKELTDRFPLLLSTVQAGIRSLMAIPLISKDEVIGILHIQSIENNTYGEKDLILAERVWNQIAGAIANVQLYSERKQAEEALRQSEETAMRLSQENATMAEIGRIVSSTLNIDDVYERFAEKVRELVPFDRITLNIFNPRDNTLLTAYVTGLDVPDRLKGNAIPVVGTLAEEVIRTRTKLFIQAEDQKKVIDRFPGLLPVFQAGIRSLVAIPMVTKDEVIGVLHLQSCKPNAYVDKDLTLAERVGNQIAGAIATARLYSEHKKAEEALRQSEETARRFSQENATMAEIGRIVSSTLNIDDVYEGFAEKVRELVPFDRINIIVFNHKDNTIRAAYVTGLDVPSRMKGNVIPKVGSLAEEVMRTRTKLLIQVEDPKKVTDRFPGLLPIVQAGIRSMVSIPLITKDEVIGVLHLQSCKPNAYVDKDLILAERVGNQIAGAIANAQLYSERKRAEEALGQSEKTARRLSQENATMAEIGRIVSSTLNIEDVYENFAERVRDLIPSDRIVINTFNIEQGTVTNVYVSGKELEDRKIGGVQPLIGSGSAEMIRTKSSLLIQIEDFDEYDKYKDRLPGLLSTFRSGFRSIMNVPLISEGRIIGGLLLRSFKPYAYTDKDVRLTERVGNQIAGAIANAQLYSERKRAEEALRQSEETARRFSQENATMAEIGRIVSSTLNIDDVYERFAEKVRELIPFDRISIIILNPRDNTLRTAYVTGLDVPDRPKEKVISVVGTLAEEVMRTRTKLLIQVEDQKKVIDRFPEFLPVVQAGLRSMVAIPMITKDEVIGILHLQSCKPNAYVDKDLILAEGVGNQIAGAIANAQLYSERKRAEEALKQNQEELIKKNKEIDESRQNLELTLGELESAYKELKATQSKILQQEKMASIGQLAAGVAHEINNPMAFISSNLGTLDKYVDRLTEFIQTQSEVIESLHATEATGRLKRKQKELKLDYITEDIKELILESLDGLERVKKIVQGLKSFARVDEAEYKYADINECIESTINIVWNELKYKVTLKKDYGDLPLTKCYPQQMNQVFMNLLINAGHSIEKQGEITIRTWDGDGSIWVTISDTGHGIPKEALDKIFEPFFTTKGVGKGTGLGLSITYEIIQKHQGEITVESEEGKGTTFTVRLPIV